MKKRTIKHGKSHSKVYDAWISMKMRCYNPNDSRFQHYGGRGIKVCKRWLKSFKNFYKDLGDPPTKYHSIDRINVNRDYKPSNVRWATNDEQQANKKSTPRYTFRGITKTEVEWCKELGLTNRDSITKRLQRGWTKKKALTTRNTKA
jgi:hypothetical protein